MSKGIILSKRVLILHGLGGSDYPHWQAHLTADLIKENYVVSFPAFPSRDNPKLHEWKEFLKKELKYFNPDIVVCHSLANVLWFQTSDELDIELEKLLLVAPVSKNRVVKEAASFYPYKTPKSLKAKEALMIASTNDPYITLEESIELEKELDIGIKVLEEAGHINASSGFGRFEEAFEWIKTH